jgi:hypothetical protein
MLNDTKAAALRARLEAIVKEAEDVEVQAAAAPLLHLGRLPPPRGGVHGRLLGADGYNYPSTCAIFVFIVVFPGRGLVAPPHCLFDLRRHDRHQTSPSGERSAQRPPAGEHHP